MLSRRVTLTSVILLVAGCREPTQVRIELSTDALCDDVRDTSITVSSTGELEGALSDTSTSNCSSPRGRIGSLTVVPNDSENDEFGVRVVTGLGKSAAQCTEDGYLGGCIVARRSLRFIPHRTLHLPIELEVVCLDVPCGVTQTCSNGRCVDAAIDDVNACLDANGCTVAAGAAPSTSGRTGVMSGGSSGWITTAHATGGGSSGLPATGVGANAGTGGTAAVTSDGGSSTGASFATGGEAPIGGSASVSLASSTHRGTTDTSGGTAAAGYRTTSGGTTATPESELSVAGATASIGGMKGEGGAAVTGGSSGGGTMSTGGTSSGDTTPGGSTPAGGTTPAGGSSFGGATGTTGLPALCGDGVLNPYSGEYCDMSGDTASCNANCAPSRCGDGIINTAAAEVCDGSTDSVHCTPSCVLSSCGDGYVDALTGEQCEPGLGGCNACLQDLSGRVEALRILAERDELLPDSLSLNIEVKNTGPALPIAGLILRYYYTPDSSNTQSTDCTFSNAGCSNVSLQVAGLAKSCTKASHYVQIGFKGSASLAKNESLSVQGKVRGGLLSIYNFSNDYSRPGSTLLKTETPEIALYQNGRLVWGTPPCGCGNGTLDTGEQCDHGGESAFCNADCTIASCGDSKVNIKAGENCDTGAPSLACNPECHATGLPASASAALLAWLDAARPDSVTLSPHIAKLLDRSGRGNHLSQSVADKQPYWFPEAFGRLPAVYFDGKLHELVAGSPINDLGSGSVLVVHHVVPVGLSATLAGNGWYASGGGFAIRTRPQLDGLGMALGASDGYSTVQWTTGASSGTSPPTPRVTYWAWNPPTFSWSTAGVAESVTASVAYTSTAAPFALGGISAGEPFTGWIGELMIFARELSTSERDAILAYLRSKWNVP